MVKKTFFALIPVIGAIVLFGAWIVQQTMLEGANSSLQQIYAAQGVFQTYRSNNALFNAIARLPNLSADTQDYIRAVQIYNYELGLRDMEALLGSSERRDIPGSVNAYSGVPPPDQKMKIVQERLTKIQDAIARKKERIAERKAFLTAYFSCSTLSAPSWCYWAACSTYFAQRPSSSSVAFRLIEADVPTSTVAELELRLEAPRDAALAGALDGARAVEPLLICTRPRVLIKGKRT
jgi:hypothetical protein